MFAQFSISSFVIISELSLLLVTLERYIKITRFERYNQIVTEKMVKFSILGVWFLPLFPTSASFYLSILWL